jgi:hypothetical protein
MIGPSTIDEQFETLDLSLLFCHNRLGDTKMSSEKRVFGRRARANAAKAAIPSSGEKLKDH